MTDAFHLALQAISLFVLGYGVALLGWTASLIMRAALKRPSASDAPPPPRPL